MRVCWVNACARTTGRAIAAIVPSRQRPANRRMARCVAGEARVCVASVCATITDTPENSARDVLPVKAPANQIGTSFR